MEIKTHEHFLQLFENIKSIKYSNHFLRDVRNEDSLDGFEAKILAPKNALHTEFHKLEKNIEGIHIFRAKKERFHVIYALTDNNEIIFLRAIKNFMEYEKLLSNDKELEKIINSAQP